MGNFPEAKSWIFNVVPWILMVPGTGIAWLFSRRLGKRGYSAGSIRKISEGIAMVTEAVCLIGVGLSNNYSMALFLCTTAMFSKKFSQFWISCKCYGHCTKALWKCIWYY